MSDIGIQLLEAIDGTLGFETGTGERLEDVSSYFVIYTSAGIPPNLGTMTPVVVVQMGTVSAESISIPPCMTHKEYPITFAVFTENNGDTEDQTAAGILDTIEDIFFQETFDLSQWCDVLSKDYAQSSIPPFSGDWNGAAEIVFNYKHTDIRSLP